MAKVYTPPKQSVAGQLFDVAFLLALVFAALFLPLWLKIAAPSRVEKLPEGVSYTMAADGTTKQWSGLTWEKLGQNPTMQAQWEKLGYTLESAADIITQQFDYTIDTAGVVITGVVIIGFFVFLIVMSDREYRQVIAEKFDGSTDGRSVSGGSAMWDILALAAWVISAAIFLWMAWDFFVVNTKYDESVLISSREGLDELLT